MIRRAIVLVVTLGYPAMVAAQESRTYVAGALMQSSQDSGYLVGGRRATHRVLPERRGRRWRTRTVRAVFRRL